MKCKVKVIRPLDHVFLKYQPNIGQVYEAEFSPGTEKKAAFCVIDVKDKKICLRKGEYELVGG